MNEHSPFRVPAIRGLDRVVLSDLVRNLAAQKLNDQQVTMKLRQVYPTLTVHQVRNIREENAIPAGVGRGRPRTKGRKTGQ